MNMLFFSVLFAAFSLLNIPQTNGLTTLPMFLIDNDNALSHLSFDPNPFRKISKQSFSYIVRDAIERTSGTIIIFLEDKFSMEDVVAKDAVGSSFSHLHDELLHNRVKFIPAVDQPYSTFVEMLPRRQHNEFYLNTQTTNLQLFNTKYRYYYVFFADSLNMTRIEALRQHDHIIKEVYFVVRQLLPGPVIAFYTGMVNHIDVTSAPLIIPHYKFDESSVTFADDKKRSLIKIGGIYLEKVDGDLLKISNFTTKSNFDDSEASYNVINIVIPHSYFNLTFRFHYDTKKWTLDRIFQNAYNDTKVDHVETPKISAPWGMSYLCMNTPIIINNRNIKSYKSLIISQYKIEISQSVLSGFGPALSCPGAFGSKMSLKLHTTLYDPPKYFTIPLVTCLFIVFILLCILFGGIVIMMSINTNDKYDDPYGKQLMFAET